MRRGELGVVGGDQRGEAGAAHQRRAASRRPEPRSRGRGCRSARRRAAAAAALASARAKATRCCSPPESSAGRWSSRCAEADRARAARAPARPRRRARRRRRAAAARRSRARRTRAAGGGTGRRSRRRRAGAGCARASPRPAVACPISRTVPPRRRVEEPGDVQERRLARAGGRDQRHDLAGGERQAGAVEHLDRGGRAGVVDLADRLERRAPHS